MGILRITNKERRKIRFSNGYVDFLRSESATKSFTVSFSEGNGLVLNAGQIIYQQLSNTDFGYIKITSTNNITLIGSGLLNLTITHNPSPTQDNQTVYFSIGGTNIALSISYNSRPDISNVSVNTPNRTEYIFTISDFLPSYTDFDNDLIGYITISNNVQGYLLYGVPYIEGDLLPVSLIESGELKYQPLDQNSTYVNLSNWRAIDLNGNLSNEAELNISVDGIEEPVVCTAPILESVDRVGSDIIFDLKWNYDGVDYNTVDPSTTVAIYVSNDNIHFTLEGSSHSFSETTAQIDLTYKNWEIFYFKIKLLNSHCDIDSNVINIVL